MQQQLRLMWIFFTPQLDNVPRFSPTAKSQISVMRCALFQGEACHLCPCAARRFISLVVLQVAPDSRQTPLSWTLASPAQRTKTCTALAAKSPTLQRSLLAAPPLSPHSHARCHHKPDRSFCSPSKESQPISVLQPTWFVSHH